MSNSVDVAAALGPDLLGVLEAKGYTTLTPVQLSVLEPELQGRDLRISSQTGSGKTLAIGFAVRELVVGDWASADGVARPRALIVAPTRELALQVTKELSWFFAAVDVSIASATGGGNYRDEQRSFARGPGIVVGTPGRLLDQLKRGAIDPSHIAAVTLDEADRMLDMGFREELDEILAMLPDEHRTHLVSATFPREVKSLADRVQANPAHVEGTPLGAANSDIDHVIHLVKHDQHLDAVVNLLMANPLEPTLIFARTRAEVAHVAKELATAGFPVRSLSGQMEQRERNRALAAFKTGEVRALVATDVAARGIDVQLIARVIHIDVPGDADTYTHRSGRTGRAGRRGTSSLVIAPSALAKAEAILRRARVEFRYEPMPSVEEVRKVAEDHIVMELTGEAQEEEILERTASLAERLAGTEHVPRIIARLLQRVPSFALAEPRTITPVAPPMRDGRPKREAGGDRERSERAERAPRPRRDDDRPRARHDGDFVPFHVSWGAAHGADARRLMAVVCRRGNIRGSDIGSIQVENAFSIVEVARAVADDFLRAAEIPDPRNPRVHIRPDRGGGGPRNGGAGRAHARPYDRAPSPEGAERPRFPRKGEASARAERAPRERSVEQEAPERTRGHEGGERPRFSREGAGGHEGGERPRFSRESKGGANEHPRRPREGARGQEANWRPWSPAREGSDRPRHPREGAGGQEAHERSRPTRDRDSRDRASVRRDEPRREARDEARPPHRAHGTTRREESTRLIPAERPSRRKLPDTKHPEARPRKKHPGTLPPKKKQRGPKR